MQNVTPADIAALGLELLPAVVFGLAAERVTRVVQRMPVMVRVSLPALFVIPYLIVSISRHMFEWAWFALYLALPVPLAWLLVPPPIPHPSHPPNHRHRLILLI